MGFTRIALTVVAGCGLVAAQTQSSGGWRRVGDPPPAPQTPAKQAQKSADRVDPLGQDPEPVDRSDAYGQPMQQGAPLPQQEPMQQQNDRPPFASSQPMQRPNYGPLPSEVTLRPGTYVSVRINQPLSSDRNQPGDPFTGTLMQPVVVDGLVVAQRGQTVYGRVAEAQRAKSDRPSRLGLELVQMTLADGTQAPVRSQLVGRQGGRTPTGQQVGTVATTTAVGAAIGAAADWGTGAAVGGGIGAAAGVIGVLLTRNQPTVIYPETPLTFELTTPLVVSTARAPQAFRYVGPEDYNQRYEAELRPRPPVVREYMAPYPNYYYGPYFGYSPYYWGPSFGVAWGRGPGYFYGRGYIRRR